MKGVAYPRNLTFFRERGTPEPLPVFRSPALDESKVNHGSSPAAYHRTRYHPMPIALRVIVLRHDVRYRTMR